MTAVVPAAAGGDSPLIVCEGLRYAYGGTPVIDDLSFSVPRGGIHGLLGKNGAGKTTTINMLMGFLEPDAGRCTVLGEPSHRLRPDTRRRIGLLHEGFVQYDFMSIAELEAFHRRFHPDWRSDLFHELVSRLEVPASRRLSRMSWGQRSQVCLGLLMAQVPELLILDDYSMGLDAGYRRLFLDYLRAYAADTGTTVLLTSHIVQDLERLIDHMLVLQRGRLLYSAPRGRFFEGFRQWRMQRTRQSSQLAAGDDLTCVEHIGHDTFVTCFLGEQELRALLRARGIEPQGWAEVPMGFEDAFLNLTGKY